MSAILNPLQLKPDNSTDNKITIETIITELTEEIGKQNPNLVCPITHKLMNDPVLAADNHNYDREAIETLLRERKPSPKTNMPFTSNELQANERLKKEIVDLLSEALRKKMSLYRKEAEDTRSAQQSYKSQFCLGLCYEHLYILGDQEALSEAIKWFSKAAEQESLLGSAQYKRMLCLARRVNAAKYNENTTTLGDPISANPDIDCISSCGAGFCDLITKKPLNVRIDLRPLIFRLQTIGTSPMNVRDKTTNGFKP